MMLITDAMVVIHLAKLSILEKSCDYFKKVFIPEEVYQEVIQGKKREFPEVPLIIGLINNKKIAIKEIQDKNLVKKANQFNLQRGEAEAIALYWQEKADIIATDDDNVRKKKELLNIKLIGTPSIILRLYQESIITKYKADQCILELRKIGWFSNAVLDKVSMEVENG